MTTKPNSRRRALVAPIALVVAAAASLAALSSGAWFTDTESVPNNTFSTGTVDLRADPANSAMYIDHMAPGDKVVAPLSLYNDGSVALEWLVTASATGDLAPALQTTIKTGVTSCDEAGFDADGVDLGSADTTVITDTPFGDMQDPIASMGRTDICIQVELPGEGTGNSYQGDAAELTFNFVGQSV